MEDHMSRRLLELMAELGDTFPVWERTPNEEPGPLDPETSGLSEQLIQDLIAWNSQGEKYYGNAFDYEDELNQWIKEGRSLAKRIEIELGQEIDVHVSYRY
jgi:hypothetical protein